MLWLHPVLMALTTLLAVYAAYLGVERFLSRHMGLRIPFRWKRHSLLGRAVVLLWLLGFLGGLAMTQWVWKASFITGDHYETALSMIPLLAVGGLTGLWMDRRKAPRTVLPLVHGVCNLLLLALAISQFSTGWDVIRDFLL